MEQELRQAFKSIKYETSANLHENIWQALVSREKYITKLKLWAFSVVGFVSLMGLIPAIKILSSDLSQSGFFEYTSLAFSDSGSIISYWKEFILSVAESLPMMSIIISLTLVFIFFLSLKHAMKQIIKSRLSLSF